ncbi:DUF4232 domain-containing protein [Amycolatopsis cihanbeyliensis]|uniref:Uncharacterized protein DUF4232 n=1 Tax=Amycolatopsis cihanbeyliensis TaxID=1128664 RepID=A0A542DMB3_AMYCI|nr:DUF4232 domain-containing protein [Amycolatopsis cihanbeyliensis]TQJ04124.1 uncharacterized protein DUF4232 [Amycolatopsis cihanbeyliensis]
MKRGTGSYLGLVAAGTLLVATLAGCGEGTQDDGAAAQPPNGDETTTTAPPATSSSGQEASGNGRPAETANEQFCRSNELKLSIGKGEGAAGTVYRPLQFTNTSDRMCVLHGYPGVSYVAGDDGHQVGPAAYRDGEKGAPVSLRPGEVAHAPVGFVQVRNYAQEECKPVPVRGLRVYPPQETESMFIKYDGTGCSSDEIPGHQLVVRTIQSGPGGRG